MSGRRTNTAERIDDGVRAAIEAAAEALFHRGGADAVTLSAVAREADFARGVIYAHFSSRQELLATIKGYVPGLAPDPAAAGPMQDDGDGAELELIAEPAPVAADAPVVDGEPAEAAPQAESASEPPSAEDPPAGTNYETLMRAQAEALQELSRQAIVGKSRQRDAADSAMARFDARLTVTEQSLAALEQRCGERLKGLDVETGALAERLHGLRQRLEKFEEKQMTALAQLRLELHNATHRPETPAVVEILAAPTYADRPAEEAAMPESAAPGPAEPDTGKPSRMADFLLSARQAAIDASVQAANQPAHRRPRWQRILLGRRRWMILAVLTVLVAWFDIYVFAHYQPAFGAIEPAANTAEVPPKPATRPEWSPHAQLVRGLKYLNGTGVPVDVDKARLWLERAALHGQPVAENLMGVLYQTGTGVAINMPVAIGWYEGAAAHGNLKAMTNLGKIYAGGWPEGTDFAKAAAWFSRAAVYGDRDAEFDLAVLSERGAGVPRNIAEAYKWYAIAGAQGDRNAATRAAVLASELSPGERATADVAVAAFRPVPVDVAANDVPAVSATR